MTATQLAPLTDAQRKVLLYLVRHFGEHQAYPVLRDVAVAMWFAGPSGALAHLKALAKKGFVRLSKHKSRGVSIPDLDIAVRTAAAQYAATIGGEVPA